MEERGKSFRTEDSVLVYIYIKNMSKDVILGLVRHFLTIAGGVLVTNGNLDVTDADTLVGSVIAIAGVIWSIVSKKKGA